MHTLCTFRAMELGGPVVPEGRSQRAFDRQFLEFDQRVIDFDGDDTEHIAGLEFIPARPFMVELFDLSTIDTRTDTHLPGPKCLPYTPQVHSIF